MRLPAVTAAAYRRITLLALVALAFIVVTGGAVRLTSSGLGCPDWPTCAQHHVVARWQYHQMVEFVNRVITGVVSVAVILAVLGSIARVPRRRDLTLLSAGLVGGIVAQIVLGGLTVQHRLAPQYVMAHFLLSMVLLWNAVLLHHRAGLEPELDAPTPGLRDPLLARALTAAAALVIVLGTVVTGTGPHAGDRTTRRLGFHLHDVARLHGSAVMLFLGLTLIFTWRLWRGGAAAGVLRRAETLLAVLVAQAGVGYVQYFTGVPAALVAVHIAGATAVWVAVLQLHLAVVPRRRRTPAPVAARPAAVPQGAMAST